MTIASPTESYDFKYTDKNVVATHRLDYEKKIYTIKVYFESEWKPSDVNIELISTIQSVKNVLVVFQFQLEGDSFIRFTKEDKLTIGKRGGEVKHSYNFSFKDCLPAHQVEIYVGDIEEELDECQLFNPKFSEKDNLLSEGYLENEKKEKAKTLKAHVPIKNSSIGKSAKKALQDESRCCSHLIAPRDNGDCGLSAFFCVLVAALVQEKVDCQNVEEVLKKVGTWADQSGITDNDSLRIALENGVERILAICKTPSQPFLRELVGKPYDQSSVNFTLRLLALMTIAQNLELLDSLVDDRKKESEGIKKLQRLLFEKTKSPGRHVDPQVIEILEHVFNVRFNLFINVVEEKGASVIGKELPHPELCNKVRGVAIYKEGESYYTLLNQRVFQFV
ncbi:MAG: hypothetical protein AAGG81_09170 [Chlamydiota bacterium]